MECMGTQVPSRGAVCADQGRRVGSRCAQCENMTDLRSGEVSQRSRKSVLQATPTTWPAGLDILLHDGVCTVVSSIGDAAFVADVIIDQAGKTQLRDGTAVCTR